jgi:hypothetical protein
MTNLKNIVVARLMRKIDQKEEQDGLCDSDGIVLRVQPDVLVQPTKGPITQGRTDLPELRESGQPEKDCKRLATNRSTSRRL